MIGAHSVGWSTQHRSPPILTARQPPETSQPATCGPSAPAAAGGNWISPSASTGRPRRWPTWRAVGAGSPPTNHVAGRPADQVAARRSADWATALATGLGIPAGALNVTVAYYAPFLHTAQPISQAATTDPDQALNHLDADTADLATS
jgi:hypothetical protein